MRGRIHWTALFTAAFVFSLLVFGALMAWVRIDDIGFNSEQLLLGFALVSISLITIMTYQSLRTADSARSIASGMAEEMLSSSEELFAELYKSSPVPYIVVSERGRIESMNYAASRLFHAKQDALNGQNLFEYLEGENPQQTALFRSYLKGGVLVKDEEVALVGSGDSPTWVLLSIFSFKDTHRARKGFVTLVDITKQKKIDKVKTEFVSLASHQLRTPISAMKWNLELLAMKHGDALLDSQKEFVGKIAESVDRMDLLVDDFLNVSKLEMGTFAVVPERIELSPFIDAVLEEHLPRAKHKQITIERAYRGSDVVQKTDAHLLRMVLGNLISNALKYTPEGGSVRIAAGLKGREVVVEVSDSGMGIPLEEQEKIFSKIFRASNARATVPEGTGLGLYIVREAARVLGGDVTFVSKEGAGTTFTVVLPRW